MTHSTVIPELIAIDAPASDLPKMDIAAKDVRAWLRDSDIEEDHPGHFVDLISIATHSENRPYINLAGTWPTIVEKWVPYAWENGYHDVAIRLITTALYNTNATADQGVWPDLILRASPQARAAWDAAMPAVLRNGFFELGKRESTFTKNFRSLVSNPSYWFSPELISSWTDDEVLSIVTSDKEYVKTIGRILSGWLTPDATREARLITWASFYRNLATKDLLRVSGFLQNAAIASFTLDEPSVLSIYKELHSEHAYLLLEHLTEQVSGDPKRRLAASFQYVAGYTKMAKAPFYFELSANSKHPDLTFLPLRNPAIWNALDHETKKSMACLSLSTLSLKAPSWRTWFRSVAGDIGLSSDLPTLLETMQDKPGDFSWAQLAAIHAAHTEATLPDLDIGGH